MLPLLAPHLVYAFEPLAARRKKSEVARQRPSVGGWSEATGTPDQQPSLSRLRAAIRQAERETGHRVYEWQFWTHGQSYDGEGCVTRADGTYGFMAVYDWLVANDFDVTELLDADGDIRPSVMEQWKAREDDGERFAWWLTTWMHHRRNFLARTLAQTEELYGEDGMPTNRHLNLIMWAGSPDPTGLLTRADESNEVEGASQRQTGGIPPAMAMPTPPSGDFHQLADWMEQNLLCEGWPPIVWKGSMDDVKLAIRGRETTKGYYPLLDLAFNLSADADLVGAAVAFELVLPLIPSSIREDLPTPFAPAYLRMDREERRLRWILVKSWAWSIPNSAPREDRNLGLAAMQLFSLSTFGGLSFGSLLSVFPWCQESAELYGLLDASQFGQAWVRRTAEVLRLLGADGVKDAQPKKRPSFADADTRAKLDILALESEVEDMDREVNGPEAFETEIRVAEVAALLGISRAGLNRAMQQAHVNPQVLPDREVQDNGTLFRFWDRARIETFARLFHKGEQPLYLHSPSRGRRTGNPGTPSEQSKARQMQVYADLQQLAALGMTTKEMADALPCDHQQIRLFLKQLIVPHARTADRIHQEVLRILQERGVSAMSPLKPSFVPSGLNASQREILEYVIGNTQESLYDLLVQYSNLTTQQLPPRYEFIALALREMQQHGTEAVRRWLGGFSREQQLGLVHRLFDTFAIQTQGDVQAFVQNQVGESGEVSGPPTAGTLRHRKDGVYEWNGRQWVRKLTEEQATAVDFTVPGELTPSRFKQAVGTFAQPLVRVGYSQKTAEKIAMAAAVLATSPLSVGLLVGLTVPGAQAAAAIPGAAEAALLVSGAMAIKNPTEALAMLVGGAEAVRRALANLPHSVKEWQQERAEASSLLDRMQREMQSVQTLAGTTDETPWWPASPELLNEENDPEQELAMQLRLEVRRRIPEMLLRRLNTLVDERKLTTKLLNERLAPLVGGAAREAYWHAEVSAVLFEDEQAKWRQIARYIHEHWPLELDDRSTGLRAVDDEKMGTILENLLAAFRTVGIPDEQHPTALLVVAELSRVSAQEGILLNASDPQMAVALAEQVKKLLMPGAGTLNGTTVGSIEHSDLEDMTPHIVQRLNHLHDELEREAKKRMQGAVNPWFLDVLFSDLMSSVFGFSLAPSSRYVEEYPEYVRLWLGEQARMISDYRPTADESSGAQEVARQVLSAPSVESLVSGETTIYRPGLFQQRIAPDHFRRWVSLGSSTLAELADDAANYIVDKEHEIHTSVRESILSSMLDADPDSIRQQMKEVTAEELRHLMDEKLSEAAQMLNDTSATENPFRQWERAGERAQANLQLLAVEYGVPLPVVDRAIRKTLQVPTSQERGMHWVPNMTSLAIAQMVYLYEGLLYGEFNDGLSLAEQVGLHIVQ